MLSKDIIEWFRFSPTGKRTGDSPIDGCEIYEMQDYPGFLITMLEEKYVIFNPNIEDYMQLDSSVLQIETSYVFYASMNLHIKQLGLGDFYN